MIRDYNSSDKEKLLAILRLNIPQYFAQTEEEDFIEYLDKHIDKYYVVELENTIVGAGGINYFEKEQVAKISWDFFHPNMQGKGWGKKLVEYRVAKIKQNPSIKAIVVRTSQHAYKFYSKCSFALKEVKKNYWAKGFDLYEMKLEL
jgi:N-acetylglutamate synthase-like GNAT family acetyltransferase